MRINNYYKDKKFEYPEIATLMEDVTKSNPSGKFIIPILTPNKVTSKTYKYDTAKLNTSNIKNDVNLYNTSISRQNYVTLTIPKYMFTSDSFSSGDKFIVVFVGGDVNKIRIIGVY